MQNPLSKKRHFQFDPARLKKAEAVAAQHPSPRIKGVRFTEAHQELCALFEEAKAGQFDHDTLKKLPKDWVLYVAGHEDAPYVEDDSRWKLEANARRAQGELARRFQRNLARLAAIAALLAGGLAVVAALLSQPSS